MDIFQFAMQMEKDGEQFYRELAAKVKDEGVARILVMLADDEVKHYHILSRMQQGAPSMTETSVLKDAKNVFRQMKGKRSGFAFDVSQKEGLKKALEIEERSERFYLEKSKEVETDAHGDLLRRIAEEERRHVHLLDHMIEFAARPESWLDNAEFSNLEDY